MRPGTCSTSSTPGWPSAGRWPTRPSVRPRAARSRPPPSSSRSRRRTSAAAIGDDFIGVQSYTRNVIGPEGAVRTDAEATRTQTGWEYWPAALEQAVRDTAAVVGDVPILVTENGIATDDDERRIAYTADALAGLQRAMADGIDVRGYLHWSLLDNYEWGSYHATFGLAGWSPTTFDRDAEALGGVARRGRPPAREPRRAAEPAPSGIADGVEGAAAGADEDLALEDRGGGLDAALELDRPELGRIDRRVAHVVAVQHAVAVAHDQGVVDDHRRLPGRGRAASSPRSAGRLHGDGQEAAVVGAGVDDAVGDGGRAPDPVAAGLLAAPLRGGSARVLHRPDQRVVGLRRVELDQLADLVVAGEARAPAPARTPRRASPPCRSRSRRRCRRRSRSGRPASLVGSSFSSRDVPALDEAAGVGEVDGVAGDGEGVLDGDVVLPGPEPARSASSWSSQPGAWNWICGSTVMRPSAPLGG